MVSICRTLDSGSRSTKATASIQCVDRQELHIHELWCLGLYNISREVHPSVRVQVPDGTASEFVTNDLAGNGRIIDIIGKISVNYSVQFLSLVGLTWVTAMPFIYNLQAPSESTG